MSVMLVEALRKLNLRAGQTYRTDVDGRTIEVRMVEEVPSAGLAEGVMLHPWVELPFEPVGVVLARPGDVPLPDPPVLPDEEASS